MPGLRLLQHIQHAWVKHVSLLAFDVLTEVEEERRSLQEQQVRLESELAPQPGLQSHSQHCMQTLSGCNVIFRWCRVEVQCCWSCFTQAQRSKRGAGCTGRQLRQGPIFCCLSAPSKAWCQEHRLKAETKRLKSLHQQIEASQSASVPLAISPCFAAGGTPECSPPDSRDGDHCGQ